MTAALISYAAQSALVMLTTAAVARLLRRSPAALRHLVWTTGLLLIVALPLASVAMPQSMFPLELPSVLRTDPARWWPSDAPAADMVAKGEGLWALKPIAQAREALSAFAPLFIWLPGSALMLWRLVRSRTALVRLRSAAREVSDAHTLHLLRSAQIAIGCRRQIRLLSGQVHVPVAFGVLRPAVMLPRNWTAWPEARLRAALLHEIAHLRRHDPLTQLIAEVVRAVHWFNPLAWIATSQLARERELACDDVVLRAGVPAIDYAREILAVAHALRNPPAIVGALAFISRSAPRQLELRLRAALDDKLARYPVRPLQMLPIVSGLTAAMLLIAALGGTPPTATAMNLPVVASFSSPSSVELDDPLSELLPEDLDPPLLTDQELAAASDREALKRLADAAAHVKTWEGDLVRERARWALRQAKNGAVVEPLLAALANPDWRVQAYAAWALAVAGDRRAVAALIPLLRHPIWRVRAQAVFSLLDLDAELPMSTLRELAQDAAWQVRIGVVHLLKPPAGSTAIEVLRQLARDPHAGVRNTARAALTPTPKE